MLINTEKNLEISRFLVKLKHIFFCFQKSPFFCDWVRSAKTRKN